MITTQEKSEQLAFYYENLLAPFIADKEVLHKKAVDCALICCNEVLGYMGSDRGYSFWSDVKYSLQTKVNTNLKE